MSISASAPAANITLTSNPDAEIFLVRGDFSLAARGVGTVQTTQPFGLYKLRVIRAGRVKEQLIELAKPQQNLDLRISDVAGATPSRFELRAGAAQLKQLVDELTVPDALSHAVNALRGGVDPIGGVAAVDSAADCQVIILANAEPELQIHPLSGLRLLPPEPTSTQAKEVPYLDALPSEALGGSGWVAHTKNIPSGSCRLELTSDALVSEQYLPVISGWLTRVSLRRRRRKGRSTESTVPREWIDYVVQLHRPVDVEAFGLDGELDTMVEDNSEFHESIRVSLEQKRRIAASNEVAIQIVKAQLEDPLISLAGAHLMLAAIERQESPQPGGEVFLPDLAFGRHTVQDLLSSLKLNHVLGARADIATHDVLPDVVSLHLRAGQLTTPVMLSSPPLYWESWDILRRLGVEAGLIVLKPELRQVLYRATAWGPYLVCKSFAVKSQSLQ